MKVLAALLLTVLLYGVVSSEYEPTSTYVSPTIKSHPYDEDDSAESLEKSPAILANENRKDDTPSPIDEKITSKLKKDDLHFLKPFRRPKEMLLQEIRTLNEETKVI